MNIDFDFQPVQATLYDMYEHGKATKIGFGGSRGGCKSISSDILMLIRRYKYPGTNGLFVMKVYSDMYDIHILPLFLRYPELAKSFNKQDMILRLPNSGGSYIRFLSGDSLSTFQQRKGREFADVMIDQSELFTQEELEFLSTINRSTNLSITPKMLFCFNPGNIGHAYHKRIFFDKIYEKNENAGDYDFLQTYGWDNAYWSQKQLIEDGLTIEDYHKWDSETRFNYFIKRSDYGKILDRLPENKRKAELLGSMEVFEGMFFSDFRYNAHVIDYEFKPEFKTIGGLDYGNETVLEVLQMDYEGRVVCAYECDVTDCESPSERANIIADFLLERGLKRLHIIYDTDMEISQLSNIGVDRTPIQIFRHVFQQRMGMDAPAMTVVNKTSLDSHKGYRQVCNEAVKEYLHINNNGQPKLFFSNKIKKLVKEMTETIIYDPKDPAGLDYLNKGGNKPHAFDGFKYAFMSLYKPVKKVVPQPIGYRQAAVNFSKRKSITTF